MRVLKLHDYWLNTMTAGVKEKNEHWCNKYVSLIVVLILSVYFTDAMFIS